MTHTRTALAATALALLAPASAASAATLTTGSCAIERLPLTVNGAGWAPGSAWSVETDQVFDSGTADAAGNFSSTTQTVPIVPGNTYKPQTFTITGKQDGVAVATTTLPVVDFTVVPEHPNGKPTGKTRWHFAGFQPGAPIYVHVRRKGRTHTQRAGKSAAPCGTLSKRLRRLPAWPAGRIAYGRYKVIVDNRKKYAKTDGSYPQFVGVVTIRKVFL